MKHAAITIGTNFGLQTKNSVKMRTEALRRLWWWFRLDIISAVIIGFAYILGTQ
jgi:hypothetical protein